MIVPIEIQNKISKYMYNLIDVINIYDQSKNHQMEIKITNLYSINKKELKKLTQNIIEQQKFKNVEKLDAKNNEKIENVNHMKKTLKILNSSSYHCGINQSGILELNLIELYACRNSKIKNVNHMKRTLKIFDCSENCGIDQYGISELNLLKLYAENNFKIINVKNVGKIY